MKIDRLAAFAQGTQGGNPAGVVLLEALPEAALMQQVAAEVGYSETVFAAPSEGGFRVRYFAPQAEVPFCGHATIALGAALGAAHGAGRYDLVLNAAQISVTADAEGAGWGARLTSPPTRFGPVGQGALSAALALFGWGADRLDPAVPPALINAGAPHLLIALDHADPLHDMAYDFDTGAALMQAEGWVTINLIRRESPELILSRNAFAGHGLYEDPATGAAAAALAGYLRDTGLQSHPFEVIQGVEMGQPCRLSVTPLEGRGAPVEVSGSVRAMS